MGDLEELGELEEMRKLFFPILLIFHNLPHLRYLLPLSNCPLTWLKLPDQLLTVEPEFELVEDCGATT